MQKPERVMVWLTENIQAPLEDFQTGAASMARKRHLASTARGFYGFCLMARIGFKRFKWFKGFKMFKWFKGFKGFNSVQSVYSALE